MTQFVFNNSVAIIGILSFFVNYSKYSSIEKTPRGIKLVLKKAYILIQQI